MDDAEYQLGRTCYGYGRWDALYWFIGPEQGQSSSENNDLKLRYEAFRKLGKNGLCDCAAFHDSIRETRWHMARKPALQRTWSRLILLLMAFLQKDLEKDADNETLRAYQRDHWGRANGETCVIELSGLPARNFTVPRDRERFSPQRIKFIRERICTCRRIFVVMYGKKDKKHWEEIAGKPLHLDRPRRVGSTVFVFAKHPVARGLGNKYWIDLGRKMRSMRPPSSSSPLLK